MQTITVKGMSCGHCSKSVTEAIQKFQVSDVKVDLPTGKVTWAGGDDSTKESIKKAISAIGFEVI